MHKNDGLENNIFNKRLKVHNKKVVKAYILSYNVLIVKKQKGIHLSKK